MSNVRSAGAVSGLAFIPPMIPTLVDKPPSGPGWIHEIKHDGYRMQLLVEGGFGRVLTRRGLDWTKKFPHIGGAATALKCRSAIVDGEAVVQRENGVTDFAALIAGEGSPVFIAFDLLHLDGEDLRRLPLTERRARLAEFLAGVDGAIGFSDAFEGTSAELFAAAERMGLEGIISKKATSGYRGGPSKVWLKTKCWTESELTLIGLDKDSKGVPIALLAREYAGVLVYAGAALVGLPKEVRERVDALSPINRPPVHDTGRKSATWLPPEIRLRIRHLRGEEGTFLRHASVKGLAE